MSPYIAYMDPMGHNNLDVDKRFPTWMEVDVFFFYVSNIVQQYCWVISMLTDRARGGVSGKWERQWRNIWRLADGHVEQELVLYPLEP